MTILVNLLIALASVLQSVLWLFSWAIIIRAVLSWVYPDPYNPVVQFFSRVTEPILQPIRRFLPAMGIDISPIIALLAIMFLRRFLMLTFGTAIL